MKINSPVGILYVINWLAEYSDCQIGEAPDGRPIFTFSNASGSQHVTVKPGVTKVVHQYVSLLTGSTPPQHGTFLKVESLLDLVTLLRFCDIDDVAPTKALLCEVADEVDEDIELGRYVYRFVLGACSMRADWERKQGVFKYSLLRHDAIALQPLALPHVNDLESLLKAIEVLRD